MVSRLWSLKKKLNFVQTKSTFPDQGNDRPRPANATSVHKIVPLIKLFHRIDQSNSFRGMIPQIPKRCSTAQIAREIEEESLFSNSPTMCKRIFGTIWCSRFGEKSHI
ncbi:hypothetical protein NPIL_128691 [Nephila pilipes]|uniref:Uncharacterized protein n=1 Tax=Nephila pilipes TaxID=299642 RepID=A0A8X6PDE7_NEPPI|nr:hypothetical protein NPIL_128691 [Nephila pilipes]